VNPVTHFSRFWRLYASGPNAWCEFGYREDCGNPRSRILASAPTPILTWPTARWPRT
jgi:hypothetical protein